jgi:hypothetical protein
MDYRHLMRLSLHLLTRHAGPQAAVIKPVNSINNIAVDLLEMLPNSKALMLYTDAKNFLLSTLKKGESAKQITRAMFDLTRLDFPYLSRLQLSDVVHMTDLKVILTLWRLQLEQANAALEKVGLGRMRSLYAEHLIAQPKSTLVKADEFLGLGLGASHIDEFLASSGQRDAKNSSESFSAEKRANRYAELEKFYGEDLDNGLQWLASNNPQMPLMPTLLQPLS